LGEPLVRLASPVPYVDGGAQVVSPEQHIGDCVSVVPPKPGVALGAWVLMAEWVEADGQKLLTRLVSNRTSAWQVKGFLHEGLYTEWPADAEHHNPGHPEGWVRLDGPAAP
jgi:hypothetical protein